MAGKKRAKPRRYSDDEKANALAALDANGGDVARTARELGVPRKTIAEWARGRVHPDVAKARQEKKAPLADRLEEVARQLADAMPDKIAAATLPQVAIALGVAVDKMRLLREQPTSITAADLTPEQRVARLAELLARAHARGAGGGDRPVDAP